MPPLRETVFQDDGGVIVIGSDGNTYAFGPADIPPGVTDPQVLEDYLNTVHIPAITQGMLQVVVHVFSISPLVFALTSVNNDSEIQPDWWVARDGAP